LYRYGAEARDFAEIGRISHLHSQNNPYAQFQQAYTLEEVENAPMIHYPLTKLQCSPVSVFSKYSQGAKIPLSTITLERRLLIPRF
jgi:acetyl-CoA acetyltransferase